MSSSNDGAMRSKIPFDQRLINTMYTLAQSLLTALQHIFSQFTISINEYLTDSFAPNIRITARVNFSVAIRTPTIIVIVIWMA